MDNGNVQEAQVVEKATPHQDTLALEALKTTVTNSRDSFKKQLAEVKDAITSREEELRILNIKLRKLEGAIEASDLYLKPSK